MKDPEGSMGAVLHRDALAAVGSQLGPCAAVLLREVRPESAAGQ
jgi:hypothetical protein